MLLIGFAFGGQGMFAGLFAQPPSVVQEAAIINLPQVYTGSSTGGSDAMVPDTGGKAPSAAEGNCVKPAGWIAYNVNPTDSLFRLSVMHGITIEEIRRANCLGEKAVIMPSDVIYVPRMASATTAPFGGANVFPTFTPSGAFQASNQVPVSQPVQQDDDEEEEAPAPPPPPPPTSAPPVVAEDPTQPPPAATEPPPPPDTGDDDDDRGGRDDDEDDDDDKDKDKDKDKDEDGDKDKDKDKGGKGGGKGKD